MIEPDTKEVAAAYGKLLTLVTMRYQTLERDNPMVVNLAKQFARNAGYADGLSELCINKTWNAMPVVTVRNVHYPSLSFSIMDIVPLWALYLQQANETLDALKAVDGVS